jgi:polyisoprenoid-binding protein YceI
METSEVAKQTKWAIDKAHSEISFTVSHLMIAHFKGVFKTYDSTICTTGKDFKTSRIDLLIDTSTINTGEVNRDKYLKSQDFFNVKKPKQITFTSSTITKADNDGNHELWGELTMMGITNNVKLNVQFRGILNYPWENERAGFTVTGKINRSNWGLACNTPTKSSGLMVNDEVEIYCKIELTKVGKKVVFTPDGMDTFFIKVS